MYFNHIFESRIKIFFFGLKKVIYFEMFWYSRMFQPKMSWWMIRSGFIRKRITILINDSNQIRDLIIILQSINTLLSSVCWDLNQTWSKVEFSSRIIVETRVGLIHQRDTYPTVWSKKNTLGPWKGLVQLLSNIIAICICRGRFILVKFKSIQPFDL